MGNKIYLFGGLYINIYTIYNIPGVLGPRISTSISGCGMAVRALITKPLSTDFGGPTFISPPQIVPKPALLTVHLRKLQPPSTTYRYSERAFGRWPQTAFQPGRKVEELLLPPQGGAASRPAAGHGHRSMANGGAVVYRTHRG